VTPQTFIDKWRAVELKERSASQSHFNDLCQLLGVVDPITADPKGEFFTFEKGASKSSGGEGWADVWKENCFGWEYKGKRKDLDAALAQLQQYALALDNPPLLIVSDMDRIRIHTNWTNTVHKTYTIKLDDLTDATHRDTLRHAFTDPERLKPEKTRQLLTEEAAEQFAKIAQRLRDRKHDAEEVAHFVNRLVFCMFAEDVELLPNKMFERMLRHCE
jgi:type II restriction/modification system DNA methylase subunit YeeA